MKNTKPYILILTLLTLSSAIELALNSGGVEWGLEGKRHFKLLNSYEFYIVENETMRKGFSTGLHFQWLNLRRDEFQLNFLSGAFFRYYSAKYSNGKNYVYQYGLQVFDIEPELKINERMSIFIRKSIINAGLGKAQWVSFGDYDSGRAYLFEIVSSSKVGIRYVF